MTHTDFLYDNLTKDSGLVDDFKRRSPVWQEHRTPDESGTGVKVTYHVREDIIRRALKKVDPIF